jgi:hypothetical protein
VEDWSQFSWTRINVSQLIKIIFLYILGKIWVRTFIFEFVKFSNKFKAFKKFYAFFVQIFFLILFLKSVKKKRKNSHFNFFSCMSTYFLTAVWKIIQCLFKQEINQRFALLASSGLWSEFRKYWELRAVKYICKMFLSTYIEILWNFLQIKSKNCY